MLVFGGRLEAVGIFQDSDIRKKYFEIQVPY